MKYVVAMFFWNKKYQKDFMNNEKIHDVISNGEIRIHDIKRIYIETIRNRIFCKQCKDCEQKGSFLCNIGIDFNLSEERKDIFHFLKYKILFNFISYDYIKAKFQNDKYDYALTNHPEISDKELDIFIGILEEMLNKLQHMKTKSFLAMIELWVLTGMIQKIIPLTINNEDLPNYTFYQDIILAKKV
jgi:hypothetical protein